MYNLINEINNQQFSLIKNSRVKKSQKINIKLVKKKKLKLRDRLRSLRKLNIYYTLFPRYTRFQLDPWFRNKKPKDVFVSDYTLKFKVFFKGRYPTYIPTLDSRFKLWGKGINKSAKSIRLDFKYLENLPTLSLFNLLPLNILRFKHLSTSKFPKLSSSINKPNNLIKNILMLNNKRTQFYLTLLSKRFWGWKTDISLYPGVLGILFGARNKHQRAIYKKKDKTILKAMTKAFTIGVSAYISKDECVSLIIRNKPRSSEFYDHFLRLTLSIFKSNLIFLALRPQIRHSFVKLRRYARVKRRLRKTIVKRTSDLHNSSVIKEAECSLVTENYLSRVKLS